MSRTQDAAVRHRRSLKQVAREEPERRVGVTHNWSQATRVFHYIDCDAGGKQCSQCDTNVQKMRVSTAAAVADRGLAHLMECRNCLRPVGVRAPHEGGYDKEPCPLCGEAVAVLAKHLPDCDGGGGVEYVR